MAGKPGSKPASAAQIVFAEKIAQEKGIVFSDDIKASAAAMSAWIDSNLDKERTKRGRKDVEADAARRSRSPPASTSSRRPRLRMICWRVRPSS